MCFNTSTQNDDTVPASPPLVAGVGSVAGALGSSVVVASVDAVIAVVSPPDTLTSTPSQTANCAPLGHTSPPG